jgi:hypothetical protein
MSRIRNESFVLLRLPRVLRLQMLMALLLPSFWALLLTGGAEMHVNLHKTTRLGAEFEQLVCSSSSSTRTRARTSSTITTTERSFLIRRMTIAGI